MFSVLFILLPNSQIPFSSILSLSPLKHLLYIPFFPCHITFDKIQHPFTIRVLGVGKEGTYFNIIKDIYNKPITNSMLNGRHELLNEIFNADYGIPYYELLVKIATEVSKTTQTICHCHWSPTIATQ